MIPLRDVLGRSTSLPLLSYLTRWDEDVLTIHSSDEIYMRLIFEHIVTRFGCPWSFTNDQGKHFIAFTREFMIHHHKTMLYHPQNNGMAEAFNNILECGLKKVCSVNRDDWNDKILAMLWAYNTTYKTLTKHMSFNLVYG